MTEQRPILDVAADGDTAGLTVAGCRQRQDRLRALLRARGLDGVLVTDPRHVHWLTGHWGRAVFSVLAFVPADGPIVLVTAYPPTDDVAADVRLTFEAARHATLVDDQPAAALAALRPFLAHGASLGSDGPWLPGLLPGVAVHDVRDAFLGLRRAKDADELVLLRRGVAGCEAAFAAARRLVGSGITEVRLYADMLAAAVEVVGEPIGEFGNDFQSGGGGGAPRRRVPRPGELMPLDVSVIVRGYCSDLCRTLIVGGQPRGAQREAHGLVLDVLHEIETMVRPGVSCRSVFAFAFNRLDGRHGWSFPHHLGHGVGLSQHEAPRLNPNWDDTFLVGDVFTVEPGLYGEDLAGGVRIEEEYVVTEFGVERLSNAPVGL